MSFRYERYRYRRICIILIMVLAVVKFAIQDTRRALLPLDHVLHHETTSNDFCLYGWLPSFRDFIGLANLKVIYVKHEKKQAMIFAT